MSTSALTVGWRASPVAHDLLPWGRRHWEIRERMTEGDAETIIPAGS